MKVVVLINSLYTGGAEFSTLSFYQWFHAQGHEVMVVCVKKAAPSVYNEFIKTTTFIGCKLPAKAES